MHIKFTIPANLKPKGHEQLTPTAAEGLTVPVGATMAVLNAETDNIRLRDDGTDATASTGIVIKTTDPPYFYVGDLSAVSVIEEGTGAVLNVLYYAPQGS